MSKGSLHVLCLVNREWNEIAKTFLNQHIIIRLKEGRTPVIPDDRRIIAQARQLSLVAEWTRNSHLKDFSPDSISPKKRESLEKEYSGFADTLETAFSHIRNVPKAGFYTGGDWSPIIELIRKIPYLHDVNILVFNGGPIELFETLSQYHPTCRVSFFSTVMDRYPLQVGEHRRFLTIDPVWLSSPMLYAVHLTVLEDDRRFHFLVHPDRVLQNIVLHAPNLKKIALRISKRSYTLLRNTLLSHFPLDEETKSDKPPGPGRIETMSWPSHTELTAEQLQDWQKITDFSVLRSLTVGYVRDPRFLQSIVDDVPFRQLKRLTISLFPQKEEDADFWQAASSMFMSLPPLTHLCLLGMYTPEFANNVLACKHGQTLIELALYGEIGLEMSVHAALKQRAGPIFSAESIEKLAQHSPTLHRLQICVQRYPNAQTEMSRALGRFPCLKKLDLVLDCLPEIDPNMMPVPLRDLTDYENSMASSLKWNGSGYDVCPKWFLRDYMINCAMSESFVKDFFAQIRTSQGRLIQLVINPLIGLRTQNWKLNQYYCFTDGAKENLITSGLFDHLASIWTVKQDNHTELQATCKRPFQPAFIDFEHLHDLKSIFHSTGILDIRPDLKVSWLE